MKKSTIVAITAVAGVLGLLIMRQYLNPPAKPSEIASPSVSQVTSTPLYPLSIQAMRSREYPGSDIVIEEVLDPGSNYSRSIVSYQSDGLKIYALLTIPTGARPAEGWPVVIFNHGYIPPEEYRTTERYVAYVDGFARSGYIVFRPDYRGHGESEGIPEGAYYSPAYATDVLNALGSLKRHPEVDTDRIGMWGHSLGGNITLRNIVVNNTDIKVAVIWAGVVGSYDDLMNRWRRNTPFQPSPRETALRRSSRQKLVDMYGSPSANLAFWNSIDPTAYVNEIMTPVQIHHGTADAEVPVAFAESLYEKLTDAKKVVELYTYDGGDHNISDPFFTTAMNRSTEFFDKYLKK